MLIQSPAQHDQFFVGLSKKNQLTDLKWKFSPHELTVRLETYDGRNRDLIVSSLFSTKEFTIMLRFCKVCRLIH